MTKVLTLELLRDAPVNTDKGLKHTLKFIHSDEPYQFTLICEFSGEIPTAWKKILGDTIGDKIRVEIGSDSRQGKLV